MSELTSHQFGPRQLDSFIWGAADRLRGYVPSGAYQSYIFPLLFFKRISDNWDLMHSAEAAEDEGSSLVAGSGERYVVPDGCHWNDLKASAHPQLVIQEILARLTAANPKELSGVFEEFDWYEVTFRA